MKYLIVGKNGQLGKEFVKELGLKKYEHSAFGHEDLDICNINQVMEIFAKEKPDILINCSAYNNVDQAEIDFNLANQTNFLGVANLIKAAKKYNFFLIHYSTDYVFDGKTKTPYTEDRIANPLNNYARSKLNGENIIKKELDSFLLFRVSWVYGDGDQNFIKKFLCWLKQNKILKISTNEVSIPTSTRLIVYLTLLAYEAKLNGLYHLVPSGYCSRYSWATEITKILHLNVNLEKCSKDIFNLPAKRPDYSVLSNKMLLTNLSISVPDWKEELRRFLINK